jgi:hypothetical protein
MIDNESRVAASSVAWGWVRATEKIGAKVQKNLPTNSTRTRLSSKAGKLLALIVPMN